MRRTKNSVVVVKASFDHRGAGRGAKDTRADLKSQYGVMFARHHRKRLPQLMLGEAFSLFCESLYLRGLGCDRRLNQ